MSIRREAEAVVPVMIVDDEVYVRVSLKNRVDWAAADAEVVGEAASGIQALERMAHLAPQVVITDIKMPGMDGLEFARRALEQWPELKFVILSGYNDFAYAKQAIQLGVSDFIEKPVNGAELTDLLRGLVGKVKAENALKQRYEQILRSQETMGRARRVALLRQAVAGTVREEDLRDEFFSHPVYSLAVLQVMAPFSRGIEVAVNHWGSASSFEVFPLERHKGLFGVIRAGSGTEDCDLRQITGKIRFDLGRMESLRGKAIYAAYTAPMTSWRDLPGAYRQAILALTNKLFHPRQLDCFVGDGPKGRTFIDADMRGDVRRLRRLAASGKEADFRRELYRLLEGSGLSVPTLEWILYELCAELGGLLPGHRPESCAAFLDEISRRDLLLRFCSMEKLCAYLSENAASVLRAVRSEEPDGGDLVERVQEYIGSNYAANLSLENMGGEFYVSPVYLSAVFKRKTGQNLSQYIENLRMERAKALLVESDLNMSEITLSVGYNDANYFGKVFRKNTGLSPSDYRKQHTESGGG